MNRISAVLVFTMLTGVAAAQTSAPPTPPSSGSNNGAGTATPLHDPGVTAPSGTGTGTGVIHTGNPDPGMAVKPPATGITPVVPPPGTSGGNPAVIPK